MNQAKRPACHALRIENLSLQVNLGCLPDERSQPQEVRFTVEFRFQGPLKGAMTDTIADTICYSEVSEILRALCAAKEFKLIERLALEAYDALRPIVMSPQTANLEPLLAVAVHKVKPPVAGLLGGSHSTCGDFFL